MQAAFIILCLVSLSIVGIAVTILMGKGDSLIAGYNTASRATQDTYDRRRVRIVVGVLLVLIALLLPVFGILLTLGYKELVKYGLPAAAVILIAATFITAHFWAKKKDDQKKRK